MSSSSSRIAGAVVNGRSARAAGAGRDLFWAGLAFAVLAVLPLLTDSRVLSDYVIRLSAFAIFATSLNILVGYGGMVSFGHAMFFGGGAYAFGLLMQKAGTSVPMGMLGAIVFAALLALAVGAICVRLKEIYFAFLTLAFQMLLYSVILSWISLTGGDQGLMGGIPRPPFLGIDLGQDRNLYWFSAAVAVLCLLAMRLVLQSPFGYTLRMVRDNADRARFLGIDVWRVKLYAFVLSGVFASIGGVLLALFVSGAYPDFSYWTMSGEAVFMIMLGGIHVFAGPALGAGLLLLFNDLVSRFTEYHGLALGIIVLLFALGFRRGIADFIGHAYRRATTGRRSQ